MGSVGRGSLEVRSFQLGADGCDRLHAGGEPDRHLPVAALPPGQPDLQHPQHQERAPRGEPLLRRGVPPGRSPEVPGCGRRSGSGLRRFPDQLHLLDELHHRGVRQRRGLLDHGGLRSIRRAAPDAGIRVGASDRRASRRDGDRGLGGHRV